MYKITICLILALIVKYGMATPTSTVAPSIKSVTADSSVPLDSHVDDDETDMEERVIKGIDLPQGSLPFIVSLRGDDPNSALSTYCGGTLVHPMWVMTAAHCFIASTTDGGNFLNPKLWHVQAGSVKIDLQWGDQSGLFSSLLNMFTGSSVTTGEDAPVHVHVKKIIQHPKYVDSDLEYDIAMMKLEKPIDGYRQIDTAFIPPKTSNYMNWPKVGSSCILAGWGCTEAGGGAVNKAQYAKFDVIKNDRCSDIYNNGAGLNDDHEFCAGYHKEGVGICPGDSGSGLFCKSKGIWVAEGIASATHRLKPGEYPGIFTRVAYFRDWLDNVIKSE